MRSLLFLTILLAACVSAKHAHFMSVTLTAVEASYQQTNDGWGLLRLRSVDSLTTFKKDKRRGSMRIEDFFEAWHLNGNSVKGKLIFAAPHKPLAVAVQLREAKFDATNDELTLMMRPEDAQAKVPSQMHAVELVFYIEPDDQTFWSKWMGL